MIFFQVSGRVPSVLTQAVFNRVSRATRGVKGLSRRRACDIGVRFVTEKEIGKLNETYRGKSCPTDVLSFIAEGREDGRTVRREGRTKAGWPRVNESVCELGDIVICASVARKEARRRSIDVKEECVRLLVHGVLHLAWMDHEKKSDEKRMFALQEGIVKKVVGGSVKGVGRVNGGTVSLLNC